MKIPEVGSKWASKNHITTILFADERDVFHEVRDGSRWSPATEVFLSLWEPVPKPKVKVSMWVNLYSDGNISEAMDNPSSSQAIYEEDLCWLTEGTTIVEVHEISWEVEEQEEE